MDGHVRPDPQCRGSLNQDMAKSTQLVLKINVASDRVLVIGPLCRF